jgi:ElaA protein
MSVLLRWHAFGDLSGDEVYEILALRQRVFILEQHCVYLDADGLDRSCLHLCGRTAEGMELSAYLRLIPPGGSFGGPSIGRVMTAPEIRRTGIGRRLMEEGIRRSSEIYPGAPLTVLAQIYLQQFYRSFGFIRSGIPHVEDGIEHVAMVRPATVR